jgi:hypothetical protein
MEYATYGPRSRHNATLLVRAAEALGYPTSVVKTTRGGYKVPQEVLDAALGVENIEEGVTYPAPSEPASEGQTDVLAPEGQADAPAEVERPRGNASREAWAQYTLTRFGIEVTDDLSRDDIKNLVNEEE